MEYVSNTLVEGDNTTRLRAHPDEKAARDYVENLAARFSRLCDLELTRLYVSIADVYQILPSGLIRHVAHFDGHDCGDGTWHGWSDE